MKRHPDLELPAALEKAEILLAGLRSKYPGASDLEIVRRKDEDSNRTMVTLLALTLVFMHLWQSNLWMLCYLLPLICMMIHAGITKSRFSRIRRLFEDRAPQNLAEFSCTPLSNDRLLSPGPVIP